MAMVANSPKMAEQIGIKQSVGKDFLAADKGKKFKKGGKLPSINKQKTHHGAMQMPNASLNKYIGHKDGGPALSVGRGEKLPVSKGGGIEVRGKTKGRMI